MSPVTVVVHSSYECKRTPQLAFFRFLTHVVPMEPLRHRSYKLLQAALLLLQNGAEEDAYLEANAFSRPNAKATEAALHVLYCRINGEEKAILVQAYFLTVITFLISD